MPFHKAGQAVQSGIKRQALRIGKQRPSFLLPESIQPPTAEWALVEDAMDGRSEKPASVKRNSFIVGAAGAIAAQLEKLLLRSAHADSTHSDLIADDSAPA